MSDYDYLNVSDGTGDAALMHITTNRSSGTTTILVDTVVGVPAKFIATYGTLLPTGLIDPVTKRDFKGHISLGTLIIDSFEVGSPDNGNTAGQAVVVKPNTGWANRVATAVQQIAQTAYPIGCIFSSTVSTSPATTFGFGTWVAFGAGRVMIGAGTSDQAFAGGATGGESRHILTTAEMPSHSHPLGFSSGSSGSGFGLVDNPNATSSGIRTSNATGGDGAHNILQPYVVVYMWTRTA